MRKTIIIHSRLAWRDARMQAAEAGRQHGLQALPIEALAARLAGGFLEPIDPDALKAAVTMALSEELGDLDRIKDLPGFPRAAAATLSKAWTAGLNLAQLVATADPEAASRLKAVGRLEQEVLRRLPTSMRRPADLVGAALPHISHARTLFGRITVHGRTEMSPVWRPLLAALAGETEVRWVAGPRHVPSWVRELGISVVDAPPQNPEIRRESCASPRHEALEALRWARELIAGRRARPEEIAIAAASPEEWDDHFLALGDMSGLDLHFVHGRKVLTTPDGQLAAALAEVLLRGFTHTRMVRLVSLLRRQGKILAGLPPDWSRALPMEAPLLDAARWRQVLSTLAPSSFRDGGDHAPALRELVDILARGLKHAAEIGELLLKGRSLAIWRKALTECPPEALDVTLISLRLPDDVAPEAAIIWAPAAALAAVPRPFVRLIGLTSRAWPRHASEDPLLPDHIVPAHRLEPLPVHDADRRDFDTIRHTTARQLFCSRSRRDAEGRLNGVSPLYPAQSSRNAPSAGAHTRTCRRLVGSALRPPGRIRGLAGSGIPPGPAGSTGTPRGSPPMTASFVVTIPSSSARFGASSRRPRSSNCCAIRSAISGSTVSAGTAERDRRSASARRPRLRQSGACHALQLPSPASRLRNRAALPRLRVTTSAPRSTARSIPSRRIGSSRSRHRRR